MQRDDSLNKFCKIIKYDANLVRLITGFKKKIEIRGT